MFRIPAIIIKEITNLVSLLKPIHSCQCMLQTLVAVQFHLPLIRSLFIKTFFLQQEAVHSLQQLCFQRKDQKPKSMGRNANTTGKSVIAKNRAGSRSGLASTLFANCSVDVSITEILPSSPSRVFRCSCVLAYCKAEPESGVPG